MRTISMSLLVVVTACTPPPGMNPPPGDGGAGGVAATGGGSGGGSAGGASAGGASAGGASAGGPADAGSWEWLPIDGSRCGSGARAGFALNAGATDELFIFVQGGGACWNRGTCVPSLLEYGPLCYYGQNVCLLNDQGGTQPTAVFVTHPNPYPADGGGALPNDLRTIGAVKALDRLAADNPFRRASFVYVPYCTGDLHSGRVQRQYTYKYGAFDAESTYTMNFWGAANMDVYLARLVTLYPNVRRIWLTGSSGGGYGASLNYDRVARAFPQAEVHLMADSSPLIDTYHFDDWRSTWAMELPPGCTTCDGGFPAVMDHLAAAYPNRRMGLLSYDLDRIITWFFHAPAGAEHFVNPPFPAFTNSLNALEGRYDARTNTKYFVVPGESHVLWGDYGLRLADGGYTAPRRSRDGGTDLKAFVDAWVDGGAGWHSSR
ncbi:MAG: hypothetical protein JNK82_26580 [Myxococcaceae bacterium]|nr:hypothetical protein [Myxococcaceae bacterium]